MPTSVFFAILQSLLVFFISNFNFNSWWNLFDFILINLVTLLIGDAYGTFLSVISGSPERSIMIMPILTQPLQMFAGFVLNDKDIPLYFLPFKYISFFRYIYLGYVDNEFTGIDGCKPGQTVPPICSYAEDHNATLGVYWYLGILMLQVVVLKIIGMIVFNYRMKKYVN